MLYWNPNTLVVPQGGGLLRFFQVTARRNVLATKALLEIVDLLVGGARTEDVEEMHGRLGDNLRVADATTWTLWENAFRNSDFFDRAVAAEHLSALPFDDFLELLTETELVSTTWPPSFDQHKRSFGDRYRGSLHEQIATESLYRRIGPAAWWTNQKFTEDHLAIRPTPYRYIEEHFLDGYFRDHFSGLKVVEIGCGTGYFSAKMARHARTVVGLDHNSDYVAIARRTWTQDQYPNLAFHIGDIIELQNGAPPFCAGAYDRVILIDIFLFLFANTYQTELLKHRATIMRNLGQLLAPGGVLLIMDPHPLWLTPWLGAEQQPFGVLTEYRNRRFKVSPNLEEVSSFLYESGMRIRRILEPAIAAEFGQIDPQGLAFMNEVPQWWFLEVERAA